MKIRDALFIIAALLLGALGAYLLLQPAAEPPPPAAELPAARAAGDTNFTNVVASGDVTAGDDITAGDDLVVTDDATVTGDLAAGAITVGGGTGSSGCTFTTDGAVLCDGSLDLAGKLWLYDDLDIAGVITTASTIITAIDNEHVGLPTVDSAAVAITTDGALWTVGASEIWFVHNVYCHVTTNFDCTGDDCAIDIGTGDDADGLLDLDDAELQATDTEGTGAPAGWQGFMSADTVGAFLATGNGFILANDTIDINVRDVSAGTNPTAGAATCYIVYTRIQ